MMLYEVFLWSKEGDLEDHVVYDCAWDLLQAWPYDANGIDVAKVSGEHTTWTTLSEIRREFKDNG